MSRVRLQGRLQWIVGMAIIIALAFSSGAAYVALGNTPGETYYGCIQRGNGSIYGVQTSGPPECRNRDTAIQWNQQGEPGLPGPQGDVGPEGPPGQPGTSPDITGLEERIIALEAHVATLQSQVTSLAELPALSIDDVTLQEGNSGTTDYVFTLTLSASSALTVTVDYATANGSASAGSDYQAMSGTLTFGPGETTKTIVVPVVGDMVGELEETFHVNLSNPTNAVILDGVGVGRILNDDAPAMNISDASCSRGTFCVFTVQLSAPSSQTVEVAFNTANYDGTAVAGTNYEATSGTLTFAPGQLTRQIPVRTYNPTFSSGYPKRFQVILSNPSDATLGKDRAIGMIY